MKKTRKKNNIEKFFFDQSQQFPLTMNKQQL